MHGDALVAAQRDHLALLLAVDQVVVVLHRHEARPTVRRPTERLRELPREHAARADVAHLAGLDDVVQRLQRLLDRRARIPAVDLVQVDVVELRAAAATRRSTRGCACARGRGRSHRASSACDLRRKHELLAHAEEPRQDAAGDDLARPAVVDVCGVEEGDPAFDRAADDRLRVGLLERPGAALVLAVAHHPGRRARHAGRCLPRVR